MPGQVNAFPLGVEIRSTEIQVAGCKQQELLVHMLHALITPLMDISAHSLITLTDTLMHGLPSSICMRLCLSMGPRAPLDIFGEGLVKTECFLINILIIMCS